MSLHSLILQLTKASIVVRGSLELHNQGFQQLKEMEQHYSLMGGATDNGYTQTQALTEDQLAQLLANGQVVFEKVTVNPKGDSSDWRLKKAGTEEYLQLSGDIIDRGKTAFEAGNQPLCGLMITVPDLTRHHRIATFLTKDDLAGYLAKNTNDLMTKPHLEQYTVKDERGNNIPDGKGDFIKAYRIVGLVKDQNGNDKPVDEFYSFVVKGTPDLKFSLI